MRGGGTTINNGKKTVENSVNDTDSKIVRESNKVGESNMVGRVI